MLLLYYVFRPGHLTMLCHAVPCHIMPLCLNQVACQSGLSVS